MIQTPSPLQHYAKPVYDARGRCIGQAMIPQAQILRTIHIAGRPFIIMQHGQFQRGGVREEMQMNGDGTARTVLALRGWKLMSLVMQCPTQADVEYLARLREENSQVPVAVEDVWGRLFAGMGWMMRGAEIGGTKEATISLGGYDRLRKMGTSCPH